MSTETKAPKLARIELSDTPAGLLATVREGRVKLDGCPVIFHGRDEHKDWHEWPESGEGRGVDVSRQFHRASVVLSWYENTGPRSSTERSRATASGVAIVGRACVVYRSRWIGKDENGDGLRAFGWDWDHASAYVRRASSAFAPPLPDAGFAALRELCERIVTQAATPERLAKAEAARFEALAKRCEERADELLQSRLAQQERASAFYALAAKVRPGLDPTDESEPERIERQARR